jgi:hypothetical protein
MVERPPPEPPPLPPFHMVAQDLKAFLPPTKPPQEFLGLVFVITTSLIFASMFVCIIVVFLSCALPCIMGVLGSKMLCFSYAHLVFVRKPQYCWVVWNGILFSYLIVVAAANLWPLFTKSMDSIFGVFLANFKITYSRFVLAEVKKMIRNWIESKTVNLLFSFVNDHLWMIIVWVLGFRSWLGKLLLNYDDLSKYHIVRDLVYLSNCYGFKVWMENVPTHYVESICNVLCLI